MVLAANPLSSPALNRIFNKPARGIGQAGWQQLQTQLAADPDAPTLPAFLFQDLDDVWVAPEVVQRVRPPSRAADAPPRIPSRYTCGLCWRFRPVLVQEASVPSARWACRCGSRTPFRRIRSGYAGMRVIPMVSQATEVLCYACCVHGLPHHMP